MKSLISILFLLAFIIQSCADNSVDIKETLPQTKFDIIFQGTVENEYGLYKIGSDGSDLIKIHEFKQCFSPQISSDGTKLFYLFNNTSSSLINEIFYFNLDDMEGHKIAEGQTFCVSPDGNRISYVFFDKTELRWEIYCCNIDGSNNRRLTNTKYQKYGLMWSPVSSEIVFTENDNLNGEFEHLLILDVDLGIIDTLVTGNSSPQISDWSLDGNYLLFDGNRRNIYEIDINQKNIIQLGNATWTNKRGKYSPDRKNIIYYSGTRSRFQVFKMKSNGSEEIRISNFENCSSFGKWSPDGSSISYLTETDEGRTSLVVANSFGGNEFVLVKKENSTQLDYVWCPVKID